MTASFPTPNSFQEFVSQSNLDQFKKELSSFSPSDQVQSLHFIHSAPVLESKDKLKCLFSTLETPKARESLGQHFSAENFLEYLDLINGNPAYQNSLSSVLVGLQSPVFSQALYAIQDKQLTLLKHESVLEPLQYHLTQFVHEGEAFLQKTEQASEALKRDFQLINQEDLTIDRLEELVERIEGLGNPLSNYSLRVNKALSIVWNTDRIDLIEKLSSLNEAIQHQLTNKIGHRATDHHLSTGLVLELESILSRVYDAALADSDAAVEGLTRLSIWYLRDYWELGLIPSIDNVSKLNLDPQEFSEEQCKEHHHRLFTEVQEQLNRLNIGTVGALKKAHLFSKRLLKSYVARHQYLLKS